MHGRSTFTAVRHDDLIHMLMAGFLQSIQETTVDIARLVHDNVQQLFSCDDRLVVFGLNGLQLLQCESVGLKHLASNALCVDCRWHFVIHRTQHTIVVWNYTTCVSQSCYWTALQMMHSTEQCCWYRTNTANSPQCPHGSSFASARLSIFRIIISDSVITFILSMTDHFNFSRI